MPDKLLLERLGKSAYDDGRRDMPFDRGRMAYLLRNSNPPTCDVHGALCRLRDEWQRGSDEYWAEKDAT